MIGGLLVCAARGAPRWGYLGRKEAVGPCRVIGGLSVFAARGAARGGYLGRKEAVGQCRVIGGPLDCAALNPVCMAV